MPDAPLMRDRSFARGSQLPSGMHDLSVRVRVSLRGDDYLVETDTSADPAGAPLAGGELIFTYYGEEWISSSI